MTHLYRFMFIRESLSLYIYRQIWSSFLYLSDKGMYLMCFFSCYISRVLYGFGYIVYSIFVLWYSMPCAILLFLYDIFNGRNNDVLICFIYIYIYVLVVPGWIISVDAVEYQYEFGMFGQCHFCIGNQGNLKTLCFLLLYKKHHYDNPFTVCFYPWRRYTSKKIVDRRCSSVNVRE